MNAFSNKALLGVAGAAAVAALAFSFAGSSAGAIIAGLTAILVGCAAIISREARVGTLYTSVACTAASVYLLSLKLQAIQPENALCNVGANFDCGKVNTSAWSEVGGFPVTLLGAAFYVGLFIAAAMSKDDDKRFHQLNFVFGVLTVGFSAFLGYQTWLLKTTCLFCIALYVGNALLLWAGARGLRQTASQWSDDLAGLFGARPFFILGGTFLGILLLGGVGWKGQTGGVPGTVGGKADAASLATAYERVNGTIQLDNTEPVLGDSNAPYTIVEWADFGCPHCAAVAKPLKALVSQNPDIQLRFKVFPLTGECHPGLEPGAPDRCAAAFAAECARQQGKFWPMQETLFANQNYFGAEELAFMARQVGLDAAAFQTCMTDAATMDGVVADAKAGDAAGIHGTPALFLKGTHGDQWIAIRGNAETIRAIVAAHREGVALLPPSEPSAQ